MLLAEREGKIAILLEEMASLEEDTDKLELVDGKIDEINELLFISLTREDLEKLFRIASRKIWRAIAKSLLK